jgi:hypothetical protein
MLEKRRAQVLRAAQNQTPRSLLKWSIIPITGLLFIAYIR